MKITTQEVKDTAALKIVAGKEGQVIGSVILYFIKNDYHQEPYGYLEALFVEEAYRRKGVGSALIREAIKEAKAHGCYKLIGNSRFENEQAHSFYENLDFKKHGYEFRVDFQ